jgi:catechol 2,3-dioxygenase-like lactoylglutathione lyase family enzyme
MRIYTVNLETAAVGPTAAYYRDVLGLPVTWLGQGDVQVMIGASALAFHETPDKVPGVYHLAFNIPENQLAPARIWLESRTPLLASAAGEVLFHSDDWNSDQVYFKDPDGNILELIARHDASNASDAAFGPGSLLNISEIGVAWDDVPAAAAMFRHNYGLEDYRAHSESFWPVGDEQGMFINVLAGRRWFPELREPAQHRPLAVEFEDAAGERRWLIR